MGGSRSETGTIRKYTFIFQKQIQVTKNHFILFVPPSGTFMTSSTPTGLTIVEDAIPSTKELELIQTIDSHPWETFSQRRVQHYGFRYNYFARTVEDNKTKSVPPLPKWSLDLCQSLLEKKYITKSPNQLIVNEYKKGQGISRHVDHSMFGGVVFSISLGSPCEMIFRQVKHPNVKYELNVQPRMFMKMEGDARYKWSHEIPLLTREGARRISLTFRYVDPKVFPKTTP
jgi:alkylated DNA repair dioxygenase AlkB